MIGNTSSEQKGRDSVAIVISVGGSDISVMQVANTDTYHLSRYSSFSGNWDTAAWRGEKACGTECGAGI